MKNIFKLLTAFAMIFVLAGCGKPVEIPTGYKGMIQTKHGFDTTRGVLEPSKFRLDWAWRYPDRLVLLDVSDSFYEMKFDTFMPKDELMLKYDIEMTMAIDESKESFIFSKVPFKSIDGNDRVGLITQKSVFDRYARAKLNTVTPSIIAQYTISEVASNREQINKYVQKRLNQELADTPFVIKVVGVTDVKYPKLITEAQEASAERRQREDTLNAQRKLDLLEIDTREQVAKKSRAIDLYEAETRALVAEKLMSKNFKFLEEQKTLRLLAQSQNKVFVPTQMLDNLSMQTPVK